ncbi:hypothetical protein C8F04DRAFT_1211952 [Mycena alexandri]|uniref:Reverse transcriptase zinc-binding domain-containing protein n=1 Tax=Mycena alexandri TaxID=1745969 RepID=A0AAD6SL80_9AGAR|nr:hypothetical protein C8F04DRAFT_1211952 [Mycena alexandri]
MTRYAVQTQSGKTPSDEDIWMSIRHKDLDRRVRNFLWKCVHQTYKCGSYWRNIPDYEHLAVCPTCNVDDNIKHALLECNSPGQELIWKLFSNMPQMSIGLILGCGLTEFKNSRGQNIPEASRLFKIIVSESAFLAWKIRCERLMSRKTFHTDSEIHNQWITCINNHLKLDHRCTSRYGNRALNFATVLKTWDGVLMDNNNGQQKSARKIGSGSLRF